MSDHNHPHARGEDEWYKYLFGLYWLNVDEARRLIVAGTIKADTYDMPIKLAGTKLLRLPESDFGSRDFRSDSEKLQAGMALDIMAGGGADAARALAIPDDKMAEPLLMVMWEHYAATKAVFGNKKKHLEGLTPGGSYPLLVDGNHRLLRRFLQGDDGTAATLVVGNWSDISQFSYSHGKKLRTRKT